jgi:hypothetical protein
MRDFAYDATTGHPISEMRLRVADGRNHDVSLTIHEVDLAIRERGGPDDAGIVMALRMIERACTDVERWGETLGAQHVVDPWLDSCAQWIAGIGSTLVSAFSYDDGRERRIALALAAEESSMRLLMGIDREGSETVAMLKNLDGNAARAANELAARIGLADRILAARVA